jgi:hypothetical protein
MASMRFCGSARCSWKLLMFSVRAARSRICRSSSAPVTPLAISPAVTDIVGTPFDRCSFFAAYSERNAPSRKFTTEVISIGPRPGHSGSLARKVTPVPGWSIRLRPTWSELLPMPS